MKAIICLVIVPIAILLRGFAIVKAWGWFIAPYFHVPYLRVPIALAISSMVGLMTYQYNPNDTREYWAHLIEVVLGPLVFLGFCLIYRAFL